MSTQTIQILLKRQPFHFPNYHNYHSDNLCQTMQAFLKAFWTTYLLRKDTRRGEDSQQFDALSLDTLSYQNTIMRLERLQISSPIIRIFRNRETNDCETVFCRGGWARGGPAC
ncbi:hypothetical protein CDAR_587181 [Caerostris darwini]|uniref:Uncharacterized protein n=1 Tax=Caerostris darwini TaxID=1538125 RepID=A0AAV4T065_9ARAC|nr:hypothetical protein CDAR_587181 [Caerostris darwini]